MCHVGLDVGINVTAPKLLVERMGMALTEAGMATSVYFLFRTFGCLAGSFLLSRVPSRTFFVVSVAMMGAGFAGLFFLDGIIPLYACIGLIGLGNSNVFPVIFSQALFHLPSQTNEVSGLMIMGLFGGTIFPLLLGISSDAMRTQDGALLVLCIGIVYLLFFSTKIKPSVSGGETN
jgi:fucose permease